MKLLIVVDYQYDFVANDGKLTVGRPAQIIEDHIHSKIVNYENENGKVIYTLDAHTEADWEKGAHPESKAFAPHCVKGTNGYTLYGKIKDAAAHGIIVEKRAYCPDLLAEPIKQLINSAEAIEVCGVVTDICVFQTVIGLYTYLINNEINTPVIVDPAACASFDLEREQWTLRYMKEVLGVQVG